MVLGMSLLNGTKIMDTLHEKLHSSAGTR